MRSGPREASRWRRARASVRSTAPRLLTLPMLPTSPTLPPSASATGEVPARCSVLVVDVLLFLLGVADRREILFGKVRSYELVIADILDRLLVRDVERFGDLRLPLAAGSLAGGRLGARGGLLVGPTLRAGGVGFSEIIELRATVVALELGSQLELRHRTLPPLGGAGFSEGGERSIRSGACQRPLTLCPEEKKG